jgi:predicted transposase YbfD/YdcC
MPDLLEETKMCFEPGAPIADECHTVEKGHGRLTERTVRTSQLLHGYSQFPGLHQVIEVTAHVKELRAGEVVKETTTVSHAATNLSPRQANAKVLDKLLRRHWMIENRHHYVRDNRWREDSATWRTGESAFAMFVLLAIALNLLRTATPLWRNRTPMTQRSIIAEHTLTATPAALLQTPT